MRERGLPSPAATAALPPPPSLFSFPSDISTPAYVYMPQPRDSRGIDPYYISRGLWKIVYCPRCGEEFFAGMQVILHADDESNRIRGCTCGYDDADGYFT